MVLQFNEETPVVRLPIHVDDHQVQNNKKSWLLLPTIMYKVLLPTAHDRDLNLFQETILKLLRSGYKSVEQLTQMLHLGKDLVAYVLGELKEKNLITENHTLTPQGIGYFSTQSNTKQMKIGYLFYDVLTKQFWNQVLLEENLVYIDADIEKNSATIQLGTLDRPRPQRTLIMRSTSNAEPAIRPELIYRTVKASADRIQNNPNLQRRYREFKLPDGNASLADIKLISMGDAVYLPTFMYLPVNLKQNTHWQVLHPFGETNSTELLDALDRIRQQYEPLNKRIDELLKTALDTVKLSVDERDKELHKYVVSIFGERYEQKHELLLSTITFVRTFKKVKQLLNESNRGAVFEDLQTEFGVFAVHGIELFETALYTLQRDNLKSKKSVNEDVVKIDVRQYAKKDARQNLKTLHTLAMKLGFDVNKNPEAYNQLLKMRAGDLIYGYQNRALKGLLGTVIIESSEQSSAQLRTLAQKFPTFLDFIQELLTLRNLSAHLTEDTFETKLAENIFTKSMYSMSILFNTLFNIDLLEEYGEFDEASLIADRKLRILSMQHVHNEFGSKLENYPHIEKLLSEMHYFKDNHPYHFVMKAVSIIEQLLNMLLIEFDYTKLPDVPENTYDVLSKASSHLAKDGFELNLVKLPESFKKFNLGKLSLELFQLKKSVPNAKLYGLFLLMCEQPASKWQTIAQQMPDMFERMIALIDMRKHGHVEVTTNEMQSIEQFVYQLIQVHLPHFENKQSNGGQQG